MIEGNHSAKPRGLPWGCRLALVLLCVILGGGVLCVYLGISTALRAEENLHSTLFAIRLVEQYVAEQGRWPSSWADLEQVKMSPDFPSPLQNGTTALRIGGQHGYDWPANSAALQQRVAIDFHVDPTTLVDQDPMTFTAISPIGPHYEYRDYGFVESLQTTIRKSIPARRSDTP